MYWVGFLLLCFSCCILYVLFGARGTHIFWASKRSLLLGKCRAVQHMKARCCISTCDNVKSAMEEAQVPTCRFNYAYDPSLHVSNYVSSTQQPRAGKNTPHEHLIFPSIAEYWYHTPAQRVEWPWSVHDTQVEFWIKVSLEWWIGFVGSLVFVVL